LAMSFLPVQILRKASFSTSAGVRVRGLPSGSPHAHHASSASNAKAGKKKGGASSAARARLAQVLATVKQAPATVTPTKIEAEKAPCGTCGATHAHSHSVGASRPEDAPPMPAASVPEDPIAKLRSAVESDMPHPAAQRKPLAAEQASAASGTSAAASSRSKIEQAAARAAAKADSSPKPAVKQAERNHSFVDNLPKITVMGVGGAGSNAVNNMIESGVQGVQFVAVNTDAQSLASSLAPTRIQIGESGLGAGAKAEMGRQAAEDSLAAVSDLIEDTHLLFITAGMGGGTGTGAAPVIAQMARQAGVLTIGVVSTPWSFEGSARLKVAKAGVAQLENNVDTLITIPNQNLMKLDKTLSMDKALTMADSVLQTGVLGITDLIVSPGLINLDFADVSTVTQGMGRAIMGTGQASGEGRAEAAADAAIRNPLLGDVDLRHSKGVLISVTGGVGMTLYEVDEVAEKIRMTVHPDATIIFGASFDNTLEDAIKVSVICTGLDANNFEDPHKAHPTPRTQQKEEASEGGLWGFFKRHF